jgi:hypothetical protein
MLDGISELEQIDKICTVLGSPNEKLWPGFSNYPNSKRTLLPILILTSRVNFSHPGEKLLEEISTWPNRRMLCYAVETVCV